MSKELCNAQSPTGAIHRVNFTDKKRDGTIEVNTMCNHMNYFEDRATGHEHVWPLTDKPVTCKRCLSAIMIEREVTPTCMTCTFMKECPLVLLKKSLTCKSFLPEAWEDMEYRKGKWFVRREKI